jgi:hypothetical protein
MLSRRFSERSLLKEPNAGGATKPEETLLMRLSRPILAAPILAVSVLAAPAFAQAGPEPDPAPTPVPDLLKHALAAPSSGQLFAYDFEDRIQDKDGTRTVRGRIDPTRKEGDRVTITYLDDQRKRPYDLKQADQKYEKNATGDIFCDTRSREDVTGVVDKGEAPGGGRLFGFIPKPEPQAEKMVRELMTRMSAEAVVDEISGLLRSFNATLTQAYKVNLFGEVKQAKFTAECQPLPNGRAYTARSDLTALISAMGRTYTQKTVQLITNVTPAG